MSENETPFQADLRRLGRQLRRGLAKRHPVSKRSLETVRAVVRQQWQQEQEQRAAGGKSKAQTQKSEQSKANDAAKTQSQDKDWGLSH